MYIISDLTRITDDGSEASTWSILLILKIVAAFQGMHVSPAKHSYAWLPRKCDYQTDRRQTKWSLCAAMFCRWHTNGVSILLPASVCVSVTVHITTTYAHIHFKFENIHVNTCCSRRRTGQIGSNIWRVMPLKTLEHSTPFAHFSHTDILNWNSI